MADLYKIVNGVEVKMSPSEQAAIESEWNINQNIAANTKYQQDRISEYGSIGDQLDMMYKDLINGTTTWKDHITNVKNKYPKPGAN